MRSIASWDGLPDRLRPILLRRSGISIGRETLVTPGSRFANFASIVLEDRVYLNHDCYLDAEAEIRIGSGASIGSHVRIITATHEIGAPDHRAGRNRAKPVVIGPGTWIGSGAVILPGVTVGSGCVIAAGAVVTRDCEADSLYAGVPARRVRALTST